MRYALTLAILFAGLTQTAAANETPHFKWTKQQFDLVESGDPVEGRKVAKKFRCKKCHNSDGISDDEDIPSIAGQRATYMYKQMMDFKSGVRPDKDMRKVAKRMSPEQMAHVSAWYSELDRPPQVGGEQMLQIKVCSSCHDKDIVEEDDNIEVAPILIGQMRQYLENTMMQFKQSDRSNDLFDRMQSVSHKLSVDEIKRLAKHYGAADIVDD